MRKLALAFLVLTACGLGSLWFPPPEPAFACAGGPSCIAPEGAGCNGSACYSGLAHLIAG